MSEKIRNLDEDDENILDEENVIESFGIILDDDVDDDEVVIIDEEQGETDFDILFKNNVNKHKSDGKHSLKRDTIFKGKVEESLTEYDDTLISNIDNGENNSYKIQTGSIFEQESRYHQDYLTQKNLAKDVFDLLTGKTELDFTQNRRKPNRQTFNTYYKMLLEELEGRYSKSEIFVELSYYFTNNIFNMFKLLDKKYATSIIIELQSKGYLKDISNIKFV